MICAKHGDVGNLIINVKMGGLTSESGINYCLVCFNEMIARECYILEESIDINKNEKKDK